MEGDVLICLVYSSISEAWISTKGQVEKLPLLIPQNSTAIFPFFDAVLFSLLIPFIVYDCYKTFFKQVTELMFCYEYTLCVNEYNYSRHECHHFCYEYSLSTL